MSIGIRGVSAITLGLFALAVVVAGSGWAASPTAPTTDDPVKPSTARTLKLPETPFKYANPELPWHFKTPGARALDNTPNFNPVTDHGATLGRVLFYDTRLSANNTMACASCHDQKKAFADPTRFSKGFDGKFVDRHAMTITNLRYYSRSRFFWDERAPSLEAQVLLPIQSKVELGQNLPDLLDILAKDQKYHDLFRSAFGSSDITRDRVARALAQFLRSMVTYQSKYDKGLQLADSVQENFYNFTAQENQGKTVFMNRCATCHMPGGQSAHFFMNRLSNNGLDNTIRKTDGGLGDITLRPNQVGLFKSPSLRNVELTGPYMHDGRFKTLDEVIDHYSRGVKQHPNLDGRVRRAGNINPQQKAALIAFMRTLTDRVFISDPKFSDPFQ